MDLLDDLARLSWGLPHLMPELVEEHVDEDIAALQPLDARLMERMPSIDAREFALPFRIEQGLVEGSEAYVDAPEDTRHWDDVEGLEYAGVRDHYEWSLVEPEGDLEDETVEADASTVEADGIMSVEADEIRMEADSEITGEADPVITAEAEVITVDDKAPLTLATTKPLDPMTTNSFLFEGIDSGAPRIATIGVQDSTSLAFGPTLEPRQ